MNLNKQLIESKRELFSFILKRTGGDLELTEDIYQDLFIKVLAKVKAGKYVEEGKPLHWIKRIASNLVIDHYRRESRIPEISYENQFNNTDAYSAIKFVSIDNEPYEDTFVSPEMSIKLKEAVKTLPKAQQELIDMRFFRNMSYKEIVKATGEKQANLLPRMHYAIKKLRKQLC